MQKQRMSDEFEPELGNETSSEDEDSLEYESEDELENSDEDNVNLEEAVAEEEIVQSTSSQNNLRRITKCVY